MKKIALLLSLVVVGQFAKAQEANNRVITTGVPFLLVAADARSAGMADMGVATSADAFSQQYNPVIRALPAPRPSTRRRTDRPSD